MFSHQSNQSANQGPSFPNLAAPAFLARWSQLLNSFYLPPRERSLFSMKFFEPALDRDEVVICDRFRRFDNCLPGLRT